MICFTFVLEGWCKTTSILIISLVTIGFLTNANVIVFSFLGKKFLSYPRTTIQSTTNMFNMGGGPIFQIIVGFIMDSQVRHSLQLSKDMMQNSLYILPISILIMTIIIMSIPVSLKT